MEAGRPGLAAAGDFPERQGSTGGHQAKRRTRRSRRRNLQSSFDKRQRCPVQVEKAVLILHRDANEGIVGEPAPPRAAIEPQGPPILDFFRREAECQQPDGPVGGRFGRRTSDMRFRAARMQRERPDENGREGRN